MNRFLAAARAVGILLGIWVVLLVTGYFTDALPPDGWRWPWGGEDDVEPVAEVEPDTPHGEDPPSGDATEPDAAIAASDPDDAAVAEAGPDAGADASAPAFVAVPVQTGPLARHRVCGPDVLRPTVAVAQVVGDPRPEILVGCGTAFSVLAFEREGDALVPVRVASFEATSSVPNVTLEAARATAADIDGDSLPDLILPYYGSAQGGATRGGALYVVRRLGSGGFDGAQNLGALAAVAVETASFDGLTGADLLAVNRGDVLSNRPSEVWAFAGGAAPRRTAVLRTGRGGQGLTAVDVDGDEHVDAVVVAQEDARVDVFHGDGTGRFPRSSTVAIDSGTEAVGADLDGDGDGEVIVVANGLQLLGAGAGDTLEPRALPAPAGIFDLSIRDVDGDGRLDLVGIAAGSLVWMQQGDALTFAEHPFLVLRELRVAAYAIGDLDADGRPDAATLAVEASGAGGWELVVVRGLPRDADVTVIPEVSTVRDAPLVLTVRLN